MEAAQEQASLSNWELWLRYFALGGSASPGKLQRHSRDGGVLDEGQHDVLVHALNERFAEMELGHPLAYALNLQL